MTIPEETWAAFLERLRRVNDAATERMLQYLRENGIPETGEQMNAAIDAAFGLATKYGEAAAELACRMYDAVAEASGMILPAAEPAPSPTWDEVAKAVQGTAKTGNPETVAASVGRQVKMTGVDTTMRNALRDGAEWAWIPHGDTCAFCLTLASRGWQRASKKAIKNGHAEHIHANCDCTYAVRFDGRSTVAGYEPEKYRAMYDAAEGDSWQEKVNSMRRELYPEVREERNARRREQYAETPVIKREKFTKYALDPVADPDKSRAFREALGYTKENCDGLIRQIAQLFDVDKCKSKGHTEYGELFEQIMDIVGENGKRANVCTGWIRKTGEKRMSLTTAYVTKKRAKRDD